jgi:phosphoribosylanthranilate isomerase
VADVVSYVGLDLAQLHGSESPDYAVRLPVAALKALKVRDADGFPDASGWPDPVMLDSWSGDSRGGTGRTWDWERARPLIDSRRVIVAGGLTPDNVGELVTRHRPHGVDVSSGVEVRPRVKDPVRVRAFVRAVREADERS